MARLTMTAAVCDTGGEGDVLCLRQVLIDDPHEMEVRVKLLTTSICRSDIHYLRNFTARQLAERTGSGAEAAFMMGPRLACKPEVRLARAGCWLALASGVAGEGPACRRPTRR